jgi:hypothetical protein
MRTVKNYWLAAGAMAGAVGMVMLFSPGRADAQYASPVRLMNTSPAPGVVSSIDDPGRSPYQSTQVVTCGGDSCTFNFGTVPAGHRLEIRNVTSAFRFATPGAFMLLSVHQNNPAAFPLPVVVPVTAQAAYGGGSVQVYLDAGQAVTVDAQVGGAPFDGALADVVTATGYMLDCSANSCAPIAH